MLIFLTIMSLQVSLLILPGPDFFVTVGNTVKYGPRYGLYTAFGVASGILLYTLVVYWVGSYLLYEEPILFKIVILIGDLYLSYIAFNLYKSVLVRENLNINPPAHLKTLKHSDHKPAYKFFINGAMTNLANADIVVLFSSMLSLVEKLSRFGKISVWLGISMTTGVWFCIVAMFFGKNITSISNRSATDLI